MQYHVPADIVLCFNVLDHIHPKQADRAVASVVRNLKPGGQLLLTTAASGPAVSKHLNFQPKSYWETKLAEAGLERAYGTEQQLLPYLQGANPPVSFVESLMVWQRPGAQVVEDTRTAEPAIAPVASMADFYATVMRG